MQVNNKTRLVAITLFIFISSLVSGCSLYRSSLRQGNSITQEDLDKLRPELSKYEVQNILGSPAMSPYFNLNQWNYTYGYLGSSQRDKAIKFKTISLYFQNGKLESYSSNYWKPANLPKASSR